MCPAGRLSLMKCRSRRDSSADFVRHEHRRHITRYIRSLQPLGYRTTPDPVDDAARTTGRAKNQHQAKLRDFVPCGALLRTPVPRAQASAAFTSDFRVITSAMSPRGMGATFAASRNRSSPMWQSNKK